MFPGSQESTSTLEEDVGEAPISPKSETANVPAPSTSLAKNGPDLSVYGYSYTQNAASG